MLSECGVPFPAVTAGSGTLLLMLSPALGFTVTHLLSLLLQSTLAVWVKWPHHSSTPMLAGSKRQFGSVCHQDPRYVLPNPPAILGTPGLLGLSSQRHGVPGHFTAVCA